MNLDELRDACSGCNKCELYKTRKNLVYGVGNSESKLMFVGEAPGEKEDDSGIPFVGPAGQLFDKYLEYVGIRRGDIYIANILKCRPPHNRDPLPQEEDACIGHLREQVRCIRPKIIVCLGRIAAQRLIKPDFKITAEHGRWFQSAGIMMSAIYHPSALLRDPSKKASTLEDMKKIKEAYDSVK